MIDEESIRKKVEEANLRDAARRLGASLCKECGTEYDPEQVQNRRRSDMPAAPVSLRGFCSERCWDTFWRKKTSSDIMKRGA